MMFSYRFDIQYIYMKYWLIFFMHVFTALNCGTYVHTHAAVLASDLMNKTADGWEPICLFLNWDFFYKSK